MFHHYCYLDPSDDDSSGEDFTPVPAKRMRADTFGASSTTSQGSGFYSIYFKHESF